MNGEPNMEAVARLKNARANSLKLMQLESSGQLDKIAKQKRSIIEESYNNETAPVMERSQAPIQNRNVGPSASKMPKAILEAFQKNPIDVEGGSSLDVLDDVFRDQLTEERTQQVQAQPQQAYTPIAQTGGGIDYPTIRAIVEEIVRKYTGSLQKKMLTENKQPLNEMNTLIIGKNFKFLAKNGDIFECTMRKVGNVNDKK